MDGTSHGQHKADTGRACGERGPRNRENAAAPGRFRPTARSSTPSEGDVMLERPDSLLQPSARSDVPPFMVMDVMAAAARLEAQGRRIIHMEVGQPAAGAPAAAIAAVRAALGGGAARLYRDARHRRRCAGASRGLWRMARHRSRSRAHRGHDRLVGGLHAGFSGRLRGRRSRRDRAARLSALSAHPLGARLRACRRSKPLQPRAGRSPAKRCWRASRASRSRASWSPRPPIPPAP